MVVIIIGGMPGSGKSTVAKYVAEKHGLCYVSAGNVFREFAAKKGYSESKGNFLEWHEYVEEHPELDKEIDQEQVKAAKKGDVVIEGRVSAYLVKNADLKFYFRLPDSVAAERLSKREGVSKRQALLSMQKREELNKERYARLYNLDVSDLSVYDFIIDTSLWKEKPQCELVNTIISLFLNQ